MKTQDILNEREKTHGDFERVSEIWIELRNIVDSNIPALCENTKITALDMILLKIARIICGDRNHDDHWDDIAGYAMLGKGRDEGKKKFSGALVIDDPRAMEEECNHDGWRICRKCGVHLNKEQPYCWPCRDCGQHKMQGELEVIVPETGFVVCKDCALKNCRSCAQK